MKKRCQHPLTPSLKCGLPSLAKLDGVDLCSAHLFTRLAKKAKAA